MPLRAKISFLVTLIGVLTANAAPLNPAQKNAVFQPGLKSAVTQAKVIKPAQAAISHKNTSWKNARIQKISATPQATSPVFVNGVSTRPAQEATVNFAVVKAAGGER